MDSKSRKEVPITWLMPREARAPFANNILVAEQNGVFILQFFEALPPPILDNSDIEKVDKVEAVLVARLAVPAECFPGFIDAMQRNLDRYKARERAVPESE
jgi:hypothetical protein